MRLLLVALFAVVTTTLIVESKAESCSVSERYFPHRVDRDEANRDSLPPAIVGTPTVEFSPSGGGGGCSGSSSCGGGPSLTIFIEASDDRSGVNNIGFDIVLESGALPIESPTMTVVPVFVGADDIGSITLGWNDALPTDGVLLITPIDLGGNSGKAVRVEAIYGVESEGCNTARFRSKPTTFAMIVIALALGFRRRRSARTS